MTGKTCSIDGCERRRTSRGWCQTHYSRWRKHGDTNRVDPPGVKKIPEECSVANCRRSVRVRNLCDPHYKRLLRYGDPEYVPVPKCSWGTPWTDEEVDVVRSTANLTHKQVAERLGRSASSVLNMRAQLVKDEGVSFKRNHTLDPHHVGKRRLLAKTCISCGLLLEAKWFIKKNVRGRGVWENRCSRCLSRMVSPSKRASDNARRDKSDNARYWRKMQQITKDRASRNGYPMDDRDHDVLRDSTLSQFEKAIKLGRTLSSVSSACSKFDYTSRVGKGDPVAGAWWIDNPNVADYAA